jgi:hypothetical protein
MNNNYSYIQNYAQEMPAWAWGLMGLVSGSAPEISLQKVDWNMGYVLLAIKKCCI